MESSRWRCLVCGKIQEGEKGVCSGCGTYLPGIEQATIFPGREHRRISRRTALAGLLGVSSLLVVGGGGLYVLKNYLQENKSDIVLYYTDDSFPVTNLAWSPDSKRIVSTDGNRSVHIWDAATGNTLFTYFQRAARSIAWSPDGRLIASVDGYAEIQVWYAAAGKRLLTYSTQTPVETLAWSPNGQYIATADGNTNDPRYVVHVFDVTTGHDIFSHDLHTDIIHAITWSPDGKYLASAGADNIIYIYDMTAKELNLTLYPQVGTSIESLAWSPNGNYLAAGSHNPYGGDTIEIWDSIAGKLFFSYGADLSFAFALSWSPDSHWLASGSDLAQIGLCNIATKKTTSFQGENHILVSAVAWSPDGTRIASGREYGAQVWPVKLALHENRA